MIFVFPVTIPANTAQTAPVVVSMPLSAGTISKIDLQFPGGVLALANVAINDGLYQLWPSNQEGSFASNDETIWWLEDYALDTAPYTLTAYGWNNDQTYQHTITVRIVVQPPADQAGTQQEINQLLNPPQPQAVM